MLLHHVKSIFTIYSTSREIQIRSPLLAITHLIIVITVWVAYLWSLNLNLKNIYQKSCPVEGAIIMKTKGELTTEDIPDSEFQVSNPELYKRIYDVSDLIFPPYDIGTSFIAVTNLHITPNQTRGFCPETKKASIAKCSQDSQCKRGTTDASLNGVFTGKCVNETGTCEVSAWCPVEKDEFPLKGNRHLFENIKDFTVMIKNSVEFPHCGKKLHYRNILESFGSDYLDHCIHSKNDTKCPIFRLNDVINWSGSNFSAVASHGAEFKIGINWDCDFDFGFTNNFCFPTYEFGRIDEVDAKVSPGLNFRISYYHEENRRTLVKMYGIKFLIVVSGAGKKFDFFQLVLAFGATIALFDLAPLVCDLMFHFFCYLKRFKPFKHQFGHFSAKARYQDSPIAYENSEKIHNIGHYTISQT